MSKDGLNGFLVHVPRQVKIRVGVGQLRMSLEKRALSQVLESFQMGGQAGGAMESIDGCLEQAGLVIQPQSDYAVTHLGDELLDDGFGHRIEDQIRTAQARYGYDAAQGRLRGFIGTSLSPVRLEEKALAVVDRILADLHYQEDSFGVHETLLRGIVDSLPDLLEAIEEELVAQTPETHQAEEGLRLRNRPAAAPRAPTRGFKASLRRGREYVHRWFSERSPEMRARSSRDPLEDRVLRARLREATLRAEKTLIESVNHFISDEVHLDSNSQTTLQRTIRRASNEAQAVELTRAWALAGGELLLNDQTLTDTVLRHLWPDIQALRADVVAKLTEHHKGESYSITDEPFDEARIAEIVSIINELVTQTTEDWTIVDVLACLYHEKAGILHVIKDSLWSIASREYLAKGYPKYLDHQTHVVCAYELSRRSEPNIVVEEFVKEIERGLDRRIQFEPDYLDSCTFTFYVEDFAVSLAAFKSIKNYDVSDEELNDPLVSPHPELNLRTENSV